LWCACAQAAEHRTPNFVVTAPTPQFAKQVGEAAEYYRHKMAVDWLGKPLPGNWAKPCPVTCKVGPMGAGGATTFCFDRGEVFGWNMTVQGTEQRILDSVIPHEVTHTIFACHFRCPLPRWADEGGATLIEHESERMRQIQTLKQVSSHRQEIPLQQLLTIQEYPQDMQRVLSLYAQGYSLTEFLVCIRGKQAFLAFVKDGMKGNWAEAFKRHYAFKSLSDVEHHWAEYRSR